MWMKPDTVVYGDPELKTLKSYISFFVVSLSMNFKGHNDLIIFFS